MQALVVEALSPDLSGVRLAEVEPPRPAEGEALVRVAATSLNFPDLLMTRGEYQFKPPLPFIPGMEVAGEILSAPPGSGLAPGDRVAGGCRVGGMAEQAAVPLSALRKLAPSVSTDVAAGFGAAYATAWTALVEIGGLTAGQWVLIHGASGGVGLAALDVARAVGARVIVSSGSPDKLAALVRDYTPDGAVLTTSRFRDEVAALTSGALADLVYDPVGGDVFDESTRCVAFGGKLLVIGFTAGRIPVITANIPLIKGFSIVGVRAGEYGRRFPDRGTAVRDRVWDLLEAGRLHPRIDRTLPLSRWREAFAAMAARELIGKIILHPGA